MKYHMHCPNRLCLLGVLVCSWMVARAQTATEAWVRRYNSPEAGSLDYLLKIVTDTAGNAIVAGYTDDGLTGRDMLVIKYSGTGTPLWTNRYNSLDNGNNQAKAVAVDGSGNVFVAGNSTVLGYSSSGMALWTNRYDGEASALAADSNGNVFVTGASVSSSGWDYMTVAYSGTGVALWTNRYNGPAGSSDDAIALAVDNQGHVFVTGHPATVGYSGTGVPLWTNRFGGWANAVAADRNGNVFVTGIADTPESNLDYKTVAYSGAGAPLWTNRYGGQGRLSDYATGVALDGSGNVFVTGYSVGVGPGGADCTTIAYTGAGVPLWTNRYRGVASALAVDSNGNVFVTGSAYTPEVHYDYETVAYSGAGATLWTNRYSGSPLDGDASAVAVDSSGNVFVTACSIGSGGDPDTAIFAYSGAGAVLWTNYYNGPGNGNDQASAMALSGSGTVFVTGFSHSFGGLADYVTIAYSEAGVALWTNRYNGPDNTDDRASAMAVDYAGNVFVTGSSYRSGFNPGNDYATIAYSGAGVALWTNRYNGPGDGDDQASAVAADNSGRVFVTGFSTGSGNNYDYATIAYSGSGLPLWTNRYNSPENGKDQANAVVVDGSGNVFVAGNPVVIGYSSTGVPLWTNLYGGVASALAVDNSGNVFVTWAYSGDYATVAYSGAGVPRWTNRYDGPDNSIDVAQDVAVDGNGNVFVTGHSYSYGEGFDYATVAYSGAGVPLWTNRYNGPDSSFDNAIAVAVDGSGNAFVTGSSVNTNGNPYSADYATIAYSGAGVALWTNRYKLARLESEPPMASLAVGRDGALYLTGSSLPTMTGGSFDYTTVKYVWRNQLVIQPFTAGASTVNLMLSGNPNSSWTVQRALTAIGPWTNLGPSLIGGNGLGIFSDTNPSAQGAFYRITQP